MIRDRLVHIKVSIFYNSALEENYINDSECELFMDFRYREIVLIKENRFFYRILQMFIISFYKVYSKKIVL